MHIEHDDKTDTDKRRVCVYLCCVHKLLCCVNYYMRSACTQTNTQYQIPPLSTGCFAVSFAQKFLKCKKSVCISIHEIIHWI